MTWRWARRALLLLLLAFGALNVLAYRSARALTRFTADGPRTPPPHALSAWQKVRVVTAGPAVPKPRVRRTPADLGLPFERHVFPGAHGLPLEAWLIPHPRSRGVVALFHGHAATKSSLLGQARELRALGWSTLLVDFHGSGGSGGGETSIGYHEADDVAAAFRYAAALPGRPRIVLFGTSMGAVAVLRAVSVHGLRPHALVLECPFDRLISTVSHRFTMMGLPAFPAAHLLVFWGGALQGFDAFGHDPVAYAARVESPTLLMSGDRDVTVTPTEARSIHDALRGPRALKMFRGLGHESFLGRRQDEWREAVSAFLDGLEPSRPSGP
jgi:uncharacterized protein